jgi:hypothetical protein
VVTIERIPRELCVPSYTRSVLTVAFDRAAGRLFDLKMPSCCNGAKSEYFSVARRTTFARSAAVPVGEQYEICDGATSSMESVGMRFRYRINRRLHGARLAS